MGWISQAGISRRMGAPAASARAFVPAKTGENRAAVRIGRSLFLWRHRRTGSGAHRERMIVWRTEKKWRSLWEATVIFP